uniref:Uncharacterized protein n=1 Tax=Arundo donax TaxID=35708 RepID=A0A0A9FJN2_ARUDO
MDGQLQVQGVIRFTFRSLLAFPVSSRTSAVKYSRMAADYFSSSNTTIHLSPLLKLTMDTTNMELK